MTVSDSLLEVTGLRASYIPDNPVLKGVSLTIESGTNCGILGLNGAGKTTLFLALTDLLASKSWDRFVFRGTASNPKDLSFKKSRFLVFTDDRSFASWTFPEYLQLIAHSYNKRCDTHLHSHLIEGFNFRQYLRAPLGTLSSGNRKKASLLVALLLEVPLLFLDEPTDFLDFAATEFLYEQLVTRKAAGLTTVLSSHITETFIRCTDSLYVLDDGLLTPPVSVPETSAELLKLLDDMPGIGDV